MKLLKRFWSEQAGAAVSTELVLVAAVVLIGVIVGLVSMRDQVVQELADVSSAVLDTTQHYEYTGASSKSAKTAGSDFEDMSDVWSPVKFEATEDEGGGDDGGDDDGDDDDGDDDDDDGDDDDGDDDDGDDDDGTDPLSQGYWKNHPEDWPVDSLTLGGETYSQAEAQDLLGSPSHGDASLILAKQLIAAKLNVANGADDSSVAGAISTADSLLGGQGPGKLPYGVGTNTSTGEAMLGVQSQLDAFNNGN